MSDVPQARACPICGSLDETRVLAGTAPESGEWSASTFSSRRLPLNAHNRMVECPVCDLLYASPVPDKEALEKGYEGAPFVSAEESAYAAETYRRLARPLLERLRPDPAVLDIGASDGTFLKALYDHGIRDLVGVEPAVASAEAAPEEVRELIRVEPFAREALGDRRFDLAASFQTLEHVSDPRQVVADTYELLAEGGILLVVVHDRRAPLARLLRSRSPIYDLAHLQLFSRRSIRELLDRCGLVDVRVESVTNRYPLRYWLKLAPIPSALKQALLARLEGTRLGDLPIAFRPGNLAASGRRPAARSGS